MAAFNLADGAGPEVEFCEVNHVGLATLNRPEVLNALTHRMVLELTGRLSRWAEDPDIHAVLLRGAGEKAFCAGGDVRAVHRSHREESSLHKDFFVDGYRLDFQIHRFSKPCVALMDGLVMGGGMGLAQGAKLRVVTPRSRIAMPETAIGFFPDVGASYFLASMPVELSLYLGVTGTSVNFADALFVGLADIAVTSERLADIESVLYGLSWSDDPLSDIRNAITAGSGVQAGSPTLETLMPAIRRHFDPSRSIAQLIESLDGETDVRYREWAAATATRLRSRSPLMMCVTREQLLRGRMLSLAECFRMELGMAARAFEDGDFIEGIRALLVDKDNAPQWRPTTPEQVTTAMIDRFFESPWDHSDHPLQDLA